MCQAGLLSVPRSPDRLHVPPSTQEVLYSMDEHNLPPFPILRPQAAPPGEIDPVCGMTVDPQHAAGVHVHAGQTYYFCSNACAQTFRAAPQS